MEDAFHCHLYGLVVRIDRCWVVRTAGWVERLSGGKEGFDGFVSEDDQRGHRPEAGRERLVAAAGKLSSQARYWSCRAISAATAAAQRLGRGGRRGAGATGGGRICWAQLGTASRLPLGRGQWCLVDAMSGNTDLRLSNVTVTFPRWLGQSVGFVVR